MLNTKERLSIYQLYQDRAGLTDEEHFHYQLLQAGWEGEQTCLKLIQDLCPASWTVMADRYMSYDQSFLQFDLLLVNDCQLLALECKNYRSALSIQDGHFYYGQRPLHSNPFNQLQKQSHFLSRLVQKAHLPQQVSAYLLLTHPDFSYTEDRRYNQVIPRYRFHDFFNSLSYSTAGPARPQEIDRLKSFQTDRRYPLSFDPSRIRIKGYICPNCQLTEFHTGLRSIHCKNCPYRTTKYQALVKLVDDFNLIHYERDFTCLDILDFINFELSHSYLRRFLHQHYEIERASRPIIFKNPYKLIPYLMRVTE